MSSGAVGQAAIAWSGARQCAPQRNASDRWFTLHATVSEGFFRVSCIEMALSTTYIIGRLASRCPPTSGFPPNLSTRKGSEVEADSQPRAQKGDVEPQPSPEHPSLGIGGDFSRSTNGSRGCSPRNASGTGSVSRIRRRLCQAADVSSGRRDTGRRGHRGGVRLGCIVAFVDEGERYFPGGRRYFACRTKPSRPTAARATGCSGKREISPEREDHLSAGWTWMRVAPSAIPFGDGLLAALVVDVRQPGGFGDPAGGEGPRSRWVVGSRGTDTRRRGG